MKEIRPWFRWQWHRYRTSDRILSLTLAGHGAYRNLLDAAWERGGRLPLDKTRWWRLALATSCDEYAIVAESVEQFFVLSEDQSCYVNDTLSEEWAETSVYLSGISEKRSAAGKKGNEARWGRSQTIATASQTDHKPSHISSSSNNTNKKPVVVGHEDGEKAFTESVNLYPQDRREFGQATQHIYLETIGKIRSLRNLDDAGAIAWLNHRIAHYAKTEKFAVKFSNFLREEIWRNVEPSPASRYIPRESDEECEARLRAEARERHKKAGQ